MTAEPQSLEDYLDFYREQVEDEECWKPAHREAMACRKVEDCVALGLFVLARIRRHNAEWAGILGEHPEQFSWAHAETFARAYGHWQEHSQQVLRCIGGCEARGFVVEGAKQFREACQEVAILPLDIDQVRGSVNALEQGRGIPFEGTARALQDRVRPGGV